jgi:hypothetical protein
LFLNKNDVYVSDISENREIRVLFEPPTFITASSEILKIYGCIERLSQLDNIGVEFKESMNTQGVIFMELMDCFKCFCSCQEELDAINRLKYIVGRGFIEFINLYDIYPDGIH